MFLNAGIVSKAVMILLLAASVWTWVLIIDGVFVAVRIFRAIESVRVGGPTGVLWPIAEAGKRAIDFNVVGETVKEKRERELFNR